MMYTDNALSTWSPIPSTLAYCNAVAWNGTQWVAGGIGRSGSSSIIVSSDGSIWTPSTSGAFTGQCNALTWNGVSWIAGGIGGSGGSTVLLSYDGGNTWNPPIGSNLLSIQCTALAARRVLPYIGIIIGQPYTARAPSSWPPGPTGTPTTIPQALDLIAACLRANVANLVVGSWPA
jgi:hypothetical protein